MRTGLRWLAGIAIGFAIFLGGYVVGFAIYSLGHTATGPELTQEPRPRLMQPDDPGFAQHLADGCPGDVSWSPCVLRLEAAPDFMNGFTMPGNDGRTITCLPAGDTFECKEN